MQSLRSFRKLVALAALVWLPMSVFAQVCATHALVSHIGGPHHPALVAPEEMTAIDDAAHAHHAVVAVVAVVDAATFWQSVDEYDTGCNMKSVCAFASMAALTSADTDMHFGGDTVTPPARVFAFSTRALTPDTPPPRLLAQ